MGSPVCVCERVTGGQRGPAPGELVGFWDPGKPQTTLSYQQALPVTLTCTVLTHPVMSDSATPLTVATPRLLCPGGAPGKTTGVDCMPFSRGSSRPRDGTRVSCVSCTAGGFFTTEPSGKPRISVYIEAVLEEFAIMRRTRTLKSLTRGQNLRVQHAPL